LVSAAETYFSVWERALHAAAGIDPNLYFVHQFKNRQPFAFPGLWDCWMDQDNGKKLYSFTIITTRANALLSRIHNPMPVIYDREMGRAWLKQSVSELLVLSLIMQPVRSEQLEMYEVSTLVNFAG
jgi:putative SOS response-associated peptidase YedK